MENLERVLKMWEKDAEIDQTEPGKELIRIPILHNKYLTILTNQKLAAKRINFEYLKMRKVKWEYYTGKLSQEELDHRGWEPFRYTLKSDISLYLESDIDLIKIIERKIYHEEAVSVIESILSELKSRTFQLRDFIQWERFIGGS
jgi:hypothetical protein